MARKVPEKKEDYIVIKGFVGLPDEDGVVEDVLPYERDKNGRPLRENGELVWKPITLSLYPSKVSHIVASGKLCLANELEEFYPELFNKMNAGKKKAPPKK